MSELGNEHDGFAREAGREPAAVGPEALQVRPLVGTVIGDPCGIGPEVVAKAWCSGRVHGCSRPVLIGSAEAMRRALQTVSLSARVRVVESPQDLSDSPEILDVLDTEALDPAAITVGRDSADCGRACAAWLDEADRLARRGEMAATVMGPISAEAMEKAGVLDRVVKINPGESYLLLLTGPLRVAHLTDHIPLRRISELLNEDLVASALRTLDMSLRRWGLSAPRIGVAGFNPHAHGQEEERHIAPGVRRARDAGILAEGPISPDTVFRHCIEGRYDVVLAMYHDQGHIPVKTWGFSGNAVVILGLPYLHLSVAHGTAYDIAGRGVADHSMMLNAMRAAGYLAAGAGFPKE